MFSASVLGLEFQHDRTDSELRGDIISFLIAATQEANNQYDIYCSNQPAGNCEYASPADLYVATHGTTVITFSNSEGPAFCERNTNSGQEGVICYSQSFGDIDPVLAAHELGHWFNYLVDPTGQADAYDDLTSERATPGFPDIDVAITAGYSNNGGSNREDFANMYSMWVFNSWPDPSTDTRRRQFMNDYMYLWLVRLLNK